MGKSKIEWTGSTWNPVTGCTKVSQGCKHCYAERMATRLAGRHGYPADEPFRVTLHPDRLIDPLAWKAPRMIFVCSMGDLFHKDVPDEFIAAVFGVMAMAPQHTFQVLTKRPDRMARWFEETGKDPGSVLSEGAWRMSVCDDNGQCALANYVNGWSRWRDMPDDGNPLNGTVRRWPLPNVWVGTSVEDQRAAEERIPYLLEVPATVLFLSCEPLLGPVDLKHIRRGDDGGYADVLGDGEWLGEPRECWPPGIDWVIAGGESGPGARPMHPDWVRSLRDQCENSGVPFFFKQWGAWRPADDDERAQYNNERLLVWPGGGADMWRWNGGRSEKPEARLDGRLWREMPVIKNGGAAVESEHGSEGPGACGRQGSRV